MDKLQQKIHSMAADKAGKKFTLTPEEVQNLDYKLTELERWRATSLKRLSSNDPLTDGIKYCLDKLDLSERKGKPFVALNASRLKSFVFALEAIQDMTRYAMLGGVSVKERKVIRIYFPVSVTEVGKFGGEDYAEMSNGYDRTVSEVIACAQEDLDERGLWSLYPGDSILYGKIAGVMLDVERTDEYGLRGYAKVALYKSLSGFDIASVIRFLSKQVKEWFAAKIRGHEFMSVDNDKKLAVDLSAASNAASYQTEAFLDTSTDYSVLRKIFSRISDERFVQDPDNSKRQTRQYILTDSCAEVDGAPGDILMLEDTVNHERMSFAFNMHGELV